jgi:phage repressor protein C with HTH and peptisase S24 domain
MNAIDEAEIRLPASPEIRDKARIIDGSLTEGSSGHPAPLKEGIDLGKEGVSTAHDAASYRTIPIAQEVKSYLDKNREFPTSCPMDAIRKLILERADEKGKNLAELSRKIGRNHAYLQQFIHRSTAASIPEAVRPALASELGVREDDLRASKTRTAVNHKTAATESLVADSKQPSTLSVNQQSGHEIPGSHLVGDRDLPVFGAAQGGRGAVVLTNDPVDWVLRPDSLLRVKDGYGMIVSGDSMSPRIQNGDTVLVNPHLPARAGDACIFRKHEDHGAVEICIKEFVRQTADLWHVKQFNPKKSFTLKKAEWQVCHVTVGNFFRR